MFFYMHCKNFKNNKTKEAIVLTLKINKRKIIIKKHKISLNSKKLKNYFNKTFYKKLLI